MLDQILKVKSQVTNQITELKSLCYVNKLKSGVPFYKEKSILKFTCIVKPPKFCLVPLPLKPQSPPQSP